jgi:hypothetical protein
MQVENFTQKLSRDKVVEIPAFDEQPNDFERWSLD